ncbi:hypothetical protein GCM10023093_25390 [Nemorincola caseinilytica]|uniref:Activator of Hsp90 ATPase homologue 1/2-like C-terminal domain-containing protein n=1 Tax=Nemorincola caseinilytica TaxID=2054315 RepID=A0ABP8NNC1_9BACT
MNRQTHKILIDAPPERIWNVLWNDLTYMSWSAAFSAGSRAETDWKAGSNVLFLDNTNNGMAGVIVAAIPNELMSIRHMAEVKNGIVQPDSPASREWMGAMENYTLKKAGDQTELTIEVDVTQEYSEYFARTWPLALNRIKGLAERK